MSERIERTHSAEVEEALGALFGAPEPDPAFVDGLECRLMAQEAEPSPLQCLQELIWRPLLRHRWATIGLAVLLALAVAFVAIGPRRVWADLQRLLGYVPGVGFVNLEETRVLTAPVTVTRGGVTLRVEQVLAQPEGTTIVISSEGLSPEDEFWPEGVEMEEGFEPRLRLPDDKSLEPDTFTLRWGAGTLEFPPLPSEVYRLNLELPRLPLVPAGIAAEDWEIPLTLRPATGELVNELFPQPYAPPDASDTHQGVTLHVLGVAHDPEETAVKLQLQWQEPAWKFPRIGARGAINLRDDVGHIYQHPIAPSDGSSSSSVVVAVPESTDATATPEPTMPTHEYTYPFSPVSLAAQELTLKIEGIAFDVPVDTDFTVDLGEAPQVGDTWPLDIDLQVAGFPIHIRCARLIEEEIGSREESKRRTVLQFDVVRPPEQGGRGLTGIGLDGEAAGFRGGSTSGGRPGADTFHADLEVEEGDPIPNGKIHVKVARAEIALDDTWEITWSIPDAEESNARTAPVKLHPERSVEVDGGLALALDEVVLTDRLTAIEIALDDPPPGVTLHRISHVSPDWRHELTLEDDRGRSYGEPWQRDVFWRPPEQPEPDVSRLTFDPVQPLARRMTLQVPALTVIEPATAAFDVTVPEGVTVSLDATDAPWPASQPWKIDIPVQIARYNHCFSKAQLMGINRTTTLRLTSEPYKPSRRDRWLSGFRIAAVTRPDGSRVTVSEPQATGLVGPNFGTASPLRGAGNLHRATIGLDVTDPETGFVQPGRYHVEIDGVMVLRGGPWDLTLELP
jgi:hypothetical protein